MRNIIFALGLVSAMALFSCKQDKASTLFSDAEKKAQAENVFDPESAPVLTFAEHNYDFGEIPSGAKVDHYFKFTNTGESPLIIKNAVASCGCTVPVWPKEPIAPGVSDSIKVSFDAGTRSGRQSKTVTLTTNTVKGKDEISFSATLPESAAAKPSVVNQLSN